MPDRLDLDRALRSVGDDLDRASRPVTPAAARGRVPVAREPVRLRPGFRAGLAGTLAGLVLAAGVVVVRTADAGEHRVDVGSPATAVGEEQTVTKSDAVPLPETGLAFDDGQRTVLLSFDGRALARGQALTPSVWRASDQVIVRDEGRTAVVQAGGDRAAPGSECDRGQEVVGLRVAVCGGTPGNRQDIVAYPHDGGTPRTLDGSMLEPGHWEWAFPSPDGGRYVLAQWRRSCGGAQAVLLPADGRALPGMANMLVFEGTALGWAPDGRAVIQGVAESCADRTDRGVVLYDVAAQATTQARPPGAGTARVWVRRG